jgi:hypothetical protein
MPDPIPAKRYDVRYAAEYRLAITASNAFPMAHAERIAGRFMHGRRGGLRDRRADQPGQKFGTLRDQGTAFEG